MPDYQKLSIFIPTINETTLEEVVSAACREAPGAEIIIIGYGDAERIATKHQTDFLDTKTKTPKSIGINLAMKRTSRDWIIILDADAIPEFGWGKAMLEEFEKDTQLFSGAVNIDYGNYWMKVYNLSLLHEFAKDSKPSYRRHLPAISLGYTREIYNAIGPYSEEIVRSEDYEWTLRAYEKGLRSFFTNTPLIIHKPVNKHSFLTVMQYWVNSGDDNRRVRIRYANLLKTPTFMRWPAFVLLASPVLAIVPTFRIFLNNPERLFKYFALIPGIYLTKIAWCIGVYKHRHVKGLTT